jgi:hypothetical protein
MILLDAIEVLALPIRIAFNSHRDRSRNDIRRHTQ